MSKNIAKLAAYTLAGSAISGVGLSAGRDFWKTLKKEPGKLIVYAMLFGALILPYFGARELVRGHDRTWPETIIKTIIGSALLFSLGLLGAFIILFFFFSLIGMSETNTADGVYAAAQMPSFLIAFGFALIPACFGLLAGVWQRPKRVRLYKVARQNRKFLDSIGIVETGGERVTHRDDDGNDLRFLEAHSDRLMFLAVGRRNRRAYIHLDDRGGMIGYSGVVEHGSKTPRPKRRRTSMKSASFSSIDDQEKLEESSEDRNFEAKRSSSKTTRQTADRIDPALARAAGRALGTALAQLIIKHGQKR